MYTFISEEALRLIQTADAQLLDGWLCSGVIWSVRVLESSVTIIPSQPGTAQPPATQPVPSHIPNWPEPLYHLYCETQTN